MRNEKFVQFANEIQEGEKITLVKFNDFGSPYCLHTTVKAAEIKPYAQYEETLQIINKPKRKRSYFRHTIKPNDELIIWKGWVNVDTEMYRTSETTASGTIIRTGLSCFSNDYMEIALKSVKVDPILTNGIYNDEDIKQLNKNDFIYQIVSASGVNYFTYEQLEDNFTITGYNSNKSNRLELQNQPFISGHSPMWGGEDNSKKVIRYEISKELAELMA